MVYKCLVFVLQVLKGNAETYSGLLDVSNFDTNLKAINKQYEEHVLNVGDFDERIFLGKLQLRALNNHSLSLWLTERVFCGASHAGLK